MSTTRRFGGMGMGLALAKRIVEAHNGKITFKSELGRGSLFALWIPAARNKSEYGLDQSAAARLRFNPDRSAAAIPTPLLVQPPALQLAGGLTTSSTIIRIGQISLSLGVDAEAQALPAAARGVSHNRIARRGVRFDRECGVLASACDRVDRAAAGCNDRPGHPSRWMLISRWPTPTPSNPMNQASRSSSPCCCSKARRPDVACGVTATAGEPHFGVAQRHTLALVRPTSIPCRCPTHCYSRPA